MSILPCSVKSKNNMQDQDTSASKPDVCHLSFNVRSYEVNADKKAAMSAVCDYFQEAAGVHAHQLEFDISRLQENNLTWVLYKMHVRINQFPERWEEVEVETWPGSGDGIRAFRDYILKNKDGDTLGVGISQWMVLNTKSRRPVRMPQAVLDMGMNKKHHVLDIDKSPLVTVKNTDSEFLLKVGEHDLDMNNHVNNVSYIRWITGYRPAPVQPGKKCMEIKIQYLSEALLGDDIYLAAEPLENAENHYRQTLYKNSDREKIATAVTTWQS